MNKPSAKKKPALTAKAALIFGSGTLTSRILGLIRDSLFFSIVPLDMRDAWVAAFRLPNFFRRLFGEGGLSVSFIPIYVGLVDSGDDKRAKKLASGVFTLLMSLALLFCGLAYVFMDQIIPIWLGGEGFTNVPGKLEMTITMARIMVFFLIFISLFAYFMALLNSHKKFGLSGYAPICLNISIITGLYLFKDSGQLMWAAAWAVVIGGILQASFLLPDIIRLKLFPKISLAPITPDVKKVLIKFIPTFFGVGVLQILTLVNTYFASQIRGAVNYLFMGDRLLELPLSLIAVSIGTTLLPTLSGYWNKGDKESFLISVSKHLSLFYFLAIPAAFGLWFLGGDIISVLFKRGEFNADDVVIVKDILKIYSVTLLMAGSLKILNQSLYAIGDTLSPALISGAGLAVHLFLAPSLMTRYGLNGLVLSTALISCLNVILCVTVIHKKNCVVALETNLKPFRKMLCSRHRDGNLPLFYKPMAMAKRTLYSRFPNATNSHRIGRRHLLWRRFYFASARANDSTEQVQKTIQLIRSC